MKKLDITSVAGSAFVFIPLWLNTSFLCALFVTLGIAIQVGNGIQRGQDGT